MSEPTNDRSVRNWHKGDTSRKLGALLMSGSKPVDLSGKTVKFWMQDEDGADVVAEVALAAGDVQPTQVFTVDTALNLIVANDHRVEENMQIVVAAQTTLPSGLFASTRYFAHDITDNSFKLSRFAKGIGPVTLSSSGVGTLTFYIVGSCQYDFAAGDVDTVGDYPYFFRVYDGSERDTYPVDGQKRILRIVDEDTE